MEEMHGNKDPQMGEIIDGLRRIDRTNARIAAALEKLASSVDEYDHVFCIKGNITSSDYRSY